ncbi:MAG: hypothetical protein ACD_52C00317G0002 [uncultured bacterium]|uniref:Glycosyltransferase RgtA/B/C/D-like domain-containing protein n=1 Tax=Candidatus Woesebacteria bacterium RIFCSPHIGHO2_12_FULL_41_24 TaxID=1802510 RepID=A0A1F8ARL9_9BACT|nr:MAG: hypothetical protein ACD_52C00317G0002 [uncultured bacterium]OGM13227.1 MAG: hypothetical protein A2W15_04860 [Candidatus Woesebacteria bacterium RBG_16_41_13]OGM30629.1 MAG: hypothetical protein A2873_00755 [Candidatus Woesebacteria bacterium RIFCSPHIGHO2_01_FULL_42_80]OGM35766.1 MAG: hypothetical protein A3D84_00635 [Candidatus Woesebacteria bacterium RIFCSPHIGHO2_02_FULL_42_20]OGM53825.1 MAG: hypothetical protein A3E44_05405 [Candidatus Woesebacteria bacterium RIFCSPHIGHO2_12_FULL_41
MKKILALIIIIHLFVLTRITFFPNSEMFIYPYLTNKGLLPYKQILDQHFPGLLFLPVNFDNLGMRTPQAALLWQMAAVALTHLFVFILSQKVLDKRKFILLPSLLYLIWQPFFEGFIQWLDVFLPLFLISSAYFLLKYIDAPKKVKYLEISGLVLGLGIIFKQVLIPVVLLVGLYLFIKNGAKIASIFILSTLLPVLLMLLYLSLIGVLNDFFYWTVTYNLTTFADYGRKWVPSLSHFIRFAFVFGAGLSGWFLGFKTRKVFLTGLYGVGALSAVYARFDFVHLQPALPFVVILTTYAVTRLKNRLVVYFGLCYLFVAFIWGVKFYRGNWNGNITFFDDNVYRVASVVRGRIRPGSKIFVYGAPAHLYQMTQTLPAGNVFIFQFPWFMRVSQDRILTGIIVDKPEIIIADRTVSVDSQKLLDYTGGINAYISKYYQTTEVIGNYEILERR